MRTIGSPACWLATLLALSTSPALAGVPREAGDVVIERRQVELDAGVTRSVELGTLYVPENRRDPGSRLIGVGFARIRAAVPTGAPPVFWLPGGPGLSVLGAFTHGDEAAPGRLRHWSIFGGVGDLVIIEQRGYSVRGERLVATSPAQALDQPATLRSDIEGMRALARAAVATNPGKDLSGYDIGQFAADVDDLRRALGYDTISLFGGSFGSQWSLAVMRLYPRSVARAVLSSVEPLDNGYDMPSQVYAALQRIARDADRDPRLAPYRPAGGLMAALAQLHERFARGTINVDVRDDAGHMRRVVLGSGDLQQALLSHTQEAAAWPAFILSLYHGHYDAWAREVIGNRAVATTKLIGPLADSSLGVSAGRLHMLDTDPAIDLLGRWNFAGNIGSAADWPTPDMGDAFRQPLRNTMPIVFVHGDWDTSTPIENTLGLLPYFPNGHAVLVHRGGHDGAFYQLRGEPAAKQALLEFLRTGRSDALPVEVSLPVPRFELPPFPPPRGAADGVRAPDPR